MSSAESIRKEGLEHRPDEGVCHQLPEKAWAAGPNAQNLRGQGLYQRRSPELADGTKAVKKKTTGCACGGDGPSTSGGSRDGTKGKKRGRDADGNEDDSNKRQKTEGEKAPPKPMVACKEPRKKAVVYPLIDRKLPVLYISCPKERTLLATEY